MSHAADVAAKRGRRLRTLPHIHLAAKPGHRIDSAPYFTMSTIAPAAYDSKIEGNIIFTQARRRDQLDAQKLALADADGPRLLRHRAHGHGRSRFDIVALRRGGDALFAPAERRDDRRRHGDLQNGARREAHLGPDARAEVVHRHGRLRLAAAACIAATRCCRGSTSSSRWTSTFPAARRGPRRCIEGLLRLQRKIDTEHSLLEQKQELVRELIWTGDW